MIENFNLMLDLLTHAKKRLNENPSLYYEEAKELSLNHVSSNFDDWFATQKLGFDTQINDMMDAKIFLVDDKIKQLLLLTDNEVYNRHLTYDKMYIDCRVDIGGKDFRGFLIVKDNFGTIITAFVYDGNSSDLLTVPLYDTYENEYNDRVKVMEYRQQLEHMKSVFGKKTIKSIQNFCLNFIDFLNHPEIIQVDVKRTEEQNLKRIKRGLLAIPSYTTIRLTGKLKRFVKKLEMNDAFSYSHEFWVRGHFRRYYDKEKYSKLYDTYSDGKHNSDYIMDNDILMRWIYPYIKGEGILIEKIYDVEKEN